ncbi:hypothetical protein BaRGS_00001357 [Batillaria attramentaria]|uniref:PPM-type phosphatase domain-containing protein n=1 Tax=Batillaria attramentaria TaxID=370345 RepID=A0ABD0M6Y2_9CAEN
MNRRYSEYSTFSRRSEYSSHASDAGSFEKQPVVEEEYDDGEPQPPTDIFRAQDPYRSDTPETFLTDYTVKPDITLFCDQCRVYIDIRQLKHHRAYHNALVTLNYKGNSTPENSELLLKRRNAVLRRMKKEATQENPIEAKQVQIVNDAYELLKADLEDTFEICRRVKDKVDTSCRGTALSCSPQCVYALGMCESPNSIWKSEMEDTKVYQDSFGEDTSKCYLGLFDGYHGRFSAEVAASLLHKMLLHEMVKFDSSVMMSTEKETHNVETDISHHSFVFGSGGKLDGAAADVSAKCSSSTNSTNKPDTEQFGDVPLTIQPDDNELTQRIIQLCEEKYEKLKEELPSNSSTPKTSRPPTYRTERKRHPLADKIAKAFDKSFYLLDILLSYGKDEWSKVRWSGCSALSVLIENTSEKRDEKGAMLDGKGDSELAGKGDDHTLDNQSKHGPPKDLGFIHLANAGNTQALLVRGNRAYKLSKEHTPSTLRERDRVLRLGGTVSCSEVDCRVNGVLATTRGLGNHGDLMLKKCVLVEPHTTSVMVDQYAQFLVLATSGVWEIFSEQEVANLLMRMLPENQIPPPSKVSSSLQDLINQNTDETEQGEGLSGKQTPDGITGVTDAIFTDSKEGTEDGKKLNKEKGMEDTKLSEKKGVEGSQGTGILTIAADLKTEAGSHMGDAEEQLLTERGDVDMVSLPVHTSLQLEGHGSVEEQRRELARNMAECLVQAALLAGSRSNVTVMVALLPGCGI